MSKESCDGCNARSVSEQEQIKKYEEMLKKKVAPCNCPLKKTCTKKVLKEEADVLCKDLETSQEAMMYHMNQHHMWEACKVYREELTKTKGKLPRDW